MSDDLRVLELPREQVRPARLSRVTPPEGATLLGPGSSRENDQDEGSGIARVSIREHDPNALILPFSRLLPGEGTQEPAPLAAMPLSDES
jgi:hypothetical protein